MRLKFLMGVITSIFLFSGCGGDNAYDGKTGLIQATAANGDAFSSLQKNVFLAHADAFKASTATFKEHLGSFEVNTTKANLQQLQEDFLTLIQEWQSVEATYIVGDYDTAMQDMPLLIDSFNQGKTDITELIDRALTNSGSVQGNFYRNDMKGVPALQYLLFGEQNSTTEMLSLMQENNKTRIDAMELVIDNLNAKATKIAEFYQNDTLFVADPQKASDVLISVMATDALKLKDWRIGEPAGLTVKYRDNPDPTRLQYYRSGYSAKAIKAILQAHMEVMSTQSYDNFGSFAKENGASSAIAQVETLLNEAMKLANELDPLEEKIRATQIDSKVTDLYIKIQTLNNTYQTAVVEALNLTTGIISVDGD